MHEWHEHEYGYDYEYEHEHENKTNGTKALVLCKTYSLRMRKSASTSTRMRMSEMNTWIDHLLPSTLTLFPLFYVLPCARHSRTRIQSNAMQCNAPLPFDSLLHEHSAGNTALAGPERRSSDVHEPVRVRGWTLAGWLDCIVGNGIRGHGVEEIHKCYSTCNVDISEEGRTAWEGEERRG